MTDVSRNDALNRYEIHVDGALAGFVEWKDTEREIRLTHTEVDDAFQGQGLAGRLVGAALADLAPRGRVIFPECPYVEGYLKKHPELEVEVRWPRRTADETGK